MMYGRDFQASSVQAMTAALVETPTRHPGGRPSSYTPEMGAVICERVAAGESLRAVCRDPDLPDRATVHRWTMNNPEFRTQYAEVRESLYQHWAEEILEIADDGTTDYQLKVARNGREYMAVDQEHINRSRLRVDTRKWLLSKLRPGQYGDHVQVDHEHGGSVTVQHELSDAERMRRLALFFVEEEAGNIIEHDKDSSVAARITNHLMPEEEGILFDTVAEAEAALANMIADYNRRGFTVTQIADVDDTLRYSVVDEARRPFGIYCIEE